MTGWKRLTAAAAVLALLLILPAAHAGTGDFAVVSNTNYLNLRAGPGTGFDRVGRVNRGGWVEILARYSASWYQCRVVDSGQIGYMSAGYLKSASSGGGGVAIVNNPGGSQFLNLRQYPSYDAPVLGIFYNGTVANVISQSGGWCYVTVGGLQGYFRVEFLSFPGGSAGQATVYSSNGGKVNLRNGPSYGYSVARQVTSGTVVSVLLRGTRFWQVSHGGDVGFIDSNFLRTGSTPPPPPGGGGGTGNAAVCSGASLNLRERPDLSARVLRQYPAGTRVQVTRQGTRWCQVTIPADGARGYMMTRYLILQGLPQVPTLMVRHPNSSYVNLREQPRQSGSRIITRVPHNSIVTVIVPGPDWMYVQYKHMKGYMMAGFLKSF